MECSTPLAYSQREGIKCSVCKEKSPPKLAQKRGGRRCISNYYFTMYSRFSCCWNKYFLMIFRDWKLYTRARLWNTSRSKYHNFTQIFSWKRAAVCIAFTKMRRERWDGKRSREGSWYKTFFKIKINWATKHISLSHAWVGLVLRCGLEIDWLVIHCLTFLWIWRCSERIQMLRYPCAGCSRLIEEKVERKWQR